MANILMPEIVAGVRAGFLEAIKQARRTGTKMLIMCDGKAVEITPDEAEALLRESERKNVT